MHEDDVIETVTEPAAPTPEVSPFWRGMLGGFHERIKGVESGNMLLSFAILALALALTLHMHDEDK